MTATLGIDDNRLADLRRLITESIRVQRDTARKVEYIDTGSILADVCARQNHVVFARRGCGKSLLLHSSADKLPANIRRVYLNCEDYKHHSFPNVLVEILDRVFAELAGNCSAWFGRKRRIKELLQDIRRQLAELRQAPDEQEQSVARTTQSRQEHDGSTGAELSAAGTGIVARLKSRRDLRTLSATQEEIEFRRTSRKLETLNRILPDLKQKMEEFFRLSTNVAAVFIHLDDYYQLKLADQPFIVDYVHRLCKDLPLYFKIATLQHASSLFVERERQPIGAQQRHDYLPIDIDYTFEDFGRTEAELHQIFYAYGALAGITPEEMDSLFKGEGFTRLVVVGGGVPRDCLSLFLEALQSARKGDGKIGKDTVRLLSLNTFESRIRELKEDSKAEEQDSLLGAVYAIRRFCLDRKTNAFVVEEKLLRENKTIGGLLNRLMDYRLIHMSATAFTHKTDPGTYRAFVIDAGCYAAMRKLEGKMVEIDVAAKDAKERMRSAPRLTMEILTAAIEKAPEDPGDALVREAQDRE